MRAAKRAGRRGTAASLGGDGPALSPHPPHHLQVRAGRRTRPQTAKVMLERTARKSGHLCPYGGTEVSMAGSYSADLRGRVLAAVEAGATPGAAARRVAGGRPTPPPLGAGGPGAGGAGGQRVGRGPKP